MKRFFSWTTGFVLLFGILSVFASTNTTPSAPVVSNTQPSLVETTQAVYPVNDYELNVKEIVPAPKLKAIPTDVDSEAEPKAAPNGTYTNTAGNEIPSPYYAPSIPAGASAQCRDGTYSFSQSRRGTCSHHGGVASWL